MTTQIQTTDLNQIHAIGEYGVNEIMAMKDTIGKDLSIPQFNLFMYDCNRLSLDPRLKHAFPILYGGKMDFRISFEGYHAMAQKSEGYIGLKLEVVCENETDDFYAETDDDGDIIKVFHRITFPRGNVVGSYAIAKREGKKNVIIFCEKAEFEKYVKKNGQFWKLDNGSLDPDMCKKHAGFRAIKAQFAVAAVAEDLTEEMNNALNGPPQDTPQRRDITDEVNQMTSEKQQTNNNAENKTSQTKATTDGVPKLQKVVVSKFRELEITTSEGREEFYSLNNIKFKDYSNPTIAEMTGLIKVLDLKIEEKKSIADSESDELDNELKDQLT